MRLCVNWLPISPSLTREVAAAVEAAGVWGIGIGDSPHYGEVYAACADVFAVTSSLTVTTGVTNPVTRHWSVHASAARTFGAAYPGRFRLGVGRGDSAVHTFGLRPARLADLESFLGSVHDAVPGLFSLVAASGPATAALAGRRANGIIAGVGGDPVALGNLRTAAGSGPEVWATMRLAIGRDAAEVAELRRRFVPRAISASHFAFASTFAGKNVPAEFQPVLTERYAAYDYGSHGRSGATSNATLFADRPDIETYLLDRFAIIGTVAECRQRLDELSPHVDGVYLSVLFENAVEQITRLGSLQHG